MEFVNVTHETQGTANVPVVAVPHMQEKGWQVVGSDGPSESTPPSPDGTTDAAAIAPPDVIDDAEVPAE